MLLLAAMFVTNRHGQSFTSNQDTEFELKLVALIKIMVAAKEAQITYYANLLSLLILVVAKEIDFSRYRENFLSPNLKSGASSYEPVIQEQHSTT